MNFGRILCGFQNLGTSQFIFSVPFFVNLLKYLCIQCEAEKESYKQSLQSWFTHRAGFQELFLVCFVMVFVSHVWIVLGCWAAHWEPRPAGVVEGRVRSWSGIHCSRGWFLPSSRCASTCRKSPFQSGLADMWHGENELLVIFSCWLVASHTVQ